MNNNNNNNNNKKKKKKKKKKSPGDLKRFSLSQTHVKSWREKFRKSTKRNTGSEWIPDQSQWHDTRILLKIKKRWTHKHGPQNKKIDEDAKRPYTQEMLRTDYREKEGIPRLCEYGNSGIWGIVKIEQRLIRVSINNSENNSRTIENQELLNRDNKNEKTLQLYGRYRTRTKEVREVLGYWVESRREKWNRY